MVTPRNNLQDQLRRLKSSSTATASAGVAATAGAAPRASQPRAPSSATTASGAGSRTTSLDTFLKTGSISGNRVISSTAGAFTGRGGSTRTSPARTPCDLQVCPLTPRPESSPICSLASTSLLSGPPAAKKARTSTDSVEEIPRTSSAATAGSSSSAVVRAGKRPSPVPSARQDALKRSKGQPSDHSRELLFLCVQGLTRLRSLRRCLSPSAVATPPRAPTPKRVSRTLVPDSSPSKENISPYASKQRRLGKKEEAVEITDVRPASSVTCTPACSLY